MSIYDLFENKENATFDKERWAAKKKAERQNAYTLIETTSAAMAENGDAFRQYLDVQSRFDRYSVSNAILISAQMSTATQLKPFAEWKKSGVYVNRNAKKVMILEPGKEYTREDGSTGVSYNAKAVYDISQTSAKQAEQEETDIRNLVSALIDASPVSFQIADDLKGMTAFYDSEQDVIFIQDGLGEMQLFTGMSKEIAAAIYDKRHGESREASTFKSYCVAYMLSKRYGMDVSDFQFEQVAGELKGLDQQAFKGELNLMRDVLVEMQMDMQKTLHKEKNKPAKDKGQAR